MTTKKILITVPVDEANWLDSHPEISKSGLFQKITEYMMENEKTTLENKDIEKVIGDSA